MKTVKKEDFHFQNDFEDALVENPGIIERYTSDNNEKYETLFKMGMYAIKGYKIFDYILLNSSFTDAVGKFELDLFNNGVYKQYIENVLSRDDEFLKAYMRVFFETEDLDFVYGNKKNIADIFINDKEYANPYKLNGLMGLCEYKCDKNTINYIKENIVRILNNADELKQISDDEKQNIINSYLDSIDQYQKEVNLSYVN